MLQLTKICKCFPHLKYISKKIRIKTGDVRELQYIMFSSLVFKNPSSPIYVNLLLYTPLRYLEDLSSLRYLEDLCNGTSRLTVKSPIIMKKREKCMRLKDVEETDFHQFTSCYFQRIPNGDKRRYLFFTGGHVIEKM